MRLTGPLVLLVGAIALVLPVAGAAWAENGDLVSLADHCASGGLIGAAAIDLCVDTSDGSLFVLDRFSGEICQFDGETGELLATLEHPFGEAPFPFFTPAMSGIAYLPDSDSLVVLNQSDMELQEVDKVTGDAIGDAVTVDVGDTSRAPVGLTYDSLAETLWFRDTQNHEIVECDLTGLVLGSAALPDNHNGLHGSGVSFVDDGDEGFLEVTYGTLLDCEATQILRLDTAAAPTGFTVDLSQSDGVIIGLARGADTLYVCTDDAVFSIDDTQPDTLPPTLLSCTSSLDARVNLSWTNHGTGIDGVYDAIDILRSSDDGDTFEVIASLDGGDSSYIDDEVASAADLRDTTLVYQVRAGDLDGDPFIECSTITGVGALVAFRSFAGNQIYDLAYNPTADEIYATDTSGRILRYETDLTFIGEIDVDISLIRGVAWDSARERLVVSRLGSTLLDIIDPETGDTEVSLTTPISDIEIGALTYDAANEHYLYLNLDDQTVVRIEASEDSGAGVGSLVRECEPPSPLGISLSTGLHLFSSRDLLVTTEQGSVQDFFADNCIPIFGEELEWSAIGACAAEENAVRGILSVGNSLYLAGGSTNAIFQLILDPEQTSFVRGDFDGDEAIELGDAISIARYLFAGDEAPACEDAADANDDGVLSISDPLYLVIYLFLEGPEPPAPFPDLGLDPTYLDRANCDG